MLSSKYFLRLGPVSLLMKVISSDALVFGLINLNRDWYFIVLFLFRHGERGKKAKHWLDLFLPSTSNSSEFVTYFESCSTLMFLSVFCPGVVFTFWSITGLSDERIFLSPLQAFFLNCKPSESKLCEITLAWNIEIDLCLQKRVNEENNPRSGTTE